MPRDNPWTKTSRGGPIGQLRRHDPRRSRRTWARGNVATVYEMNYVLVPDNQPRVQIPFLDYPDESDLDVAHLRTGAIPFPQTSRSRDWPKGTGSLTLQQWQQDVNNNAAIAMAIIGRPAPVRFGRRGDEIDAERLAGVGTARSSISTRMRCGRPA